jgi:hypothetical protein
MLGTARQVSRIITCQHGKGWLTHDHFCDKQRGGLNCVFQEKRIDSIKMRIEELLNFSEAS